MKRHDDPAPMPLELHNEFLWEPVSSASEVSLKYRTDYHLLGKSKNAPAQRERDSLDKISKSLLTFPDRL